jgi:protocatechuate 3,4-dioxygenase beta subunit
MTPPRKINERLTRREMLGFMGVASAAAVAAACGSSKELAATATNTPRATSTAAAATDIATGTPAANAVSCVISPEMTEGPYFVDEILDRSDIRSDPSTGAVSEGVPLALTINVQDVSDGGCIPLEGAVVDIWHCDAGGLYSDVAQNNTVGQKFLRGYQLTDENGDAHFTTIYPGWYMGRTVHIHVKVRTDPSSESGYEFTSQLFFDDALTDEVFANAPYNSRGERDTRNEDDSIYSGGGAQMLPVLTPTADGYAGTISVGVQF